MPLNLIFITPGTYTLEDNGIPGDGISVIRDSNGVIIFTFAHPADALGFTVTTPGVNIIVNFTDSLGAANFTLGSLTDAASSPDSIVVRNVQTTGTVTLVANGTITEGGADTAADITAGAIVMSAGAGIGTAGNAIETRTGLFEAETNTGGINIGNFGSVQIGAVAPEVDGLDVVTSGDINFTTVGSIFLTESNTVTATEVVHGGGTSGNVTLTASGFNSDIIGNVDNSAVTAARGSITLNAGRDIQLGTIGADFNNDVIASGAVTFNAGRDILVDGFADVLSDNFGFNTGADVTLNAGRNVGILNLAGTSASVTASGSGGGDVLVTTGIGGSLTVNGPGSFALGSTSGNVIVTADRILIDAASGISAPSGQIVIRPRTDGRETILGNATDSGAAIELSDVELDRIFTPNLTIGGTNAGSIAVTADISPAGAPNLTLISQDDIYLQGGIATAESIRLFAGNNMFQTIGTLTTTTLLAEVDNVGDDGGNGGSGRLQSVSGTTSVALNGNAEADTLRGAEGIDQIVHGNGGADIIFSSGEGRYFGDGGDDLIVAGLSTGLVQEFLDGGSGMDTVDTSNFGGTYIINLATGVTNFSFETFLNFEHVITGSGADTITGTSATNHIITGGGADSLNGAGGADRLIGGLGDDFYFVDVAGDVIVEAGGEGTDRIFAAASYVLAAGVSVETIGTVNNAATTAINLTGNAIVQTVVGNAGANTLDGGGGGDTMIGLGGDDFYMIRAAGDRAVEAAGAGNDRVFAAVSFQLEAGSEVETIGTIAPAATNALNLLGNALVQTIVGNAGANTIDGGGGGDTMIGGGGDDLYIVRVAGDRAVESPGGGTDRVFAAVSYTLEANSAIETLSTTSNGGLGAINLTGNNLGQAVIGNAGANVLDGKGGSDTLTGFAGADAFAFTTALGALNVDTIADFLSGTDTIRLENAVFTGLAAGALPATAFVIGAAAADANDRIVYNSTTGALFFDADGTGAGAAVQFATLTGAPALAASDFNVI